MRDLKIAVIGGFGHTGSVLGEMEGIEGCRVSAIAAVLPEEGIGNFGGHRLVKGAKEYGDYREMLRVERPEVVIVGTRLDLIAEVGMEAARGGSHLICEKPLAIERGKLAEFRKVVEEAGVMCVPMLGNRLHPLVRAAREVVDSGKLGRVALVNARKSYKWGTRPEWFGKRSMYGGTIAWVGIHALDFIEGATGERFTSVAAMQSNVGHGERAECEDNCALVLGLSGGGHATVSLDILRPEKAETWGDDWMRIVGTKGVIEVNLERGEWMMTTEAGTTREVKAGEKVANYAEFLRGIAEGRKEKPVDMERGFWLTHVCLCARDAADEGRVLEVQKFGG